MSEDGTPDVTYYAFDLWNRPADSLLMREVRLGDILPPGGLASQWKVLWSSVLYTVAEVERYEAKALAQGYEGLILRDPDGLYKFGRSTMREQGMMKLKRFVDEEAEVLGVYEEMRNDNVAKKNELGRTARSSHQENLVGKGTAGGFLLLLRGTTFKCGTGLTDAEAARWWALRDPRPLEMKLETETLTYYVLRKPGAWVKFKHFPVGAKDKPRHPVYLGPRAGWDMS
jgi:DNA ligase-1